MKIQNSKGHMVEISDRRLQRIIKNHIKAGKHDEISALVNSEVPKYSFGGFIKDYAAFNYGADIGILNTAVPVTSMATDPLTNSMELDSQQKSLMGYGQAAGAIGVDIATSGATTAQSAPVIGKGLSTGIKSGSPNSQTAQDIGTGLQIGGDVAGIAYGSTDASKASQAAYGSTKLGQFATQANKYAPIANEVYNTAQTGQVNPYSAAMTSVNAYNNFKPNPQAPQPPSSTGAPMSNYQKSYDMFHPNNTKEVGYYSGNPEYARDGGSIGTFGTRPVTNRMGHGGENNSQAIEIEGNSKQEGTQYDLSKGELLVNPGTGEVLKNWTAANSHEKGGFKTQEQEGLVIIPKNRSQEYMNRGPRERKQLITSIKSQADNRQRKALDVLKDAGGLHEGWTFEDGQLSNPELETQVQQSPERFRRGGLVKYDTNTVVGQAENNTLGNLGVNPSIFAQSIMEGGAYPAQGNQGEYNNIPGANQYTFNPNGNYGYTALNTMISPAPLGSGVIDPNATQNNQAAWHRSFSTPVSKTSTRTPSDSFDKYNKIGALAQAPSIINNLANSFAKIENVPNDVISPLEPRYISEDTGKPEIQKSYNSAYNNLKTSGQFSRRGQVSLASQLMEANWKRLLAIRDKNSGIYNDFTGRKLHADQYSAENKYRAQKEMRDAKGKRREFRGQAFADMGKLGQDYVHNQMYEEYLNKTLGKV